MFGANPTARQTAITWSWKLADIVRAMVMNGASAFPKLLKLNADEVLAKDTDFLIGTALDLCSMS